MNSASLKGSKKLAINGLAKETIYLKTQTNSRKNSLPNSQIHSAERKSLPKQALNSQVSEIAKKNNNFLKSHDNLEQSKSNHKLNIQNLKNKIYIIKAKLNDNCSINIQIWLKYIHFGYCVDKIKNQRITQARI